MSMKEFIEQSLKENGYSDIEWHDGRKGYYVLAKSYGLTSCVNIGDFVNSVLYGEKV